MGPDIVGVWFEEVTERVQADQALRSRITEIEALYQHAPVGLALFDSTLHFTRINDKLAEINDLPADAHLGKWVWDIVPPLRPSAEPKLREVLSTGRTIEAEISDETPKRPGHIRWWNENYYPLLGQDGSVVAVGAVVEEITDRKAAENILRLSAMELRHRIKNLISVVGSLARQTFPGPEMSQQRHDFEGRLRALDQANSILGDEAAWGASELTELARTIFLGNLADGRFTLDGPAVRLAPRIATACSLTLHELTTNAMKYGALASPNGRIVVKWFIHQSNGDIELSWTEIGGPPVVPPKTSGFGSRLIQQMIIAEGGKCDLRYNSTGVECTLRFNPHDGAEDESAISGFKPDRLLQP